MSDHVGVAKCVAETGRSQTPLRLMQVLVRGDVEDLFRAAIHDNDVEYLRDVIGQVRVLSTIPLPEDKP